MSTALVSQFPDISDALFQNPSNNSRGAEVLNLQPMTQMREVLSLLSNHPEAAAPLLSSLGRTRNSSGSSSSSSSSTSSTSSSSGQFAPPSPVSLISMDSSSSNTSSPQAVPHRKLDRSMSEPAKSVNSSRYKTELCRPYEENGFCKYGDKCQFAHGEAELRSLNRHPKYKTERCRTFHSTGFCPYGPRCHFIHNEDERKLSQISQIKHHQQQQLQALHQFLAVQVPRSAPQAVTQPRAVKALNFNLNLPPMVRDTLGSTADSPPSSLRGSPTLSPMMSEDFMSNGHSLPNRMFSSNNSSPPPQSAPPGFGGSAFPFNHQQQQHQSDSLTSLLTPPSAPLTPPSLSPPLNIPPAQDPMVATLAAEMQATSLQNDTNTTTTTTTQEVLKDCFTDFMLPPSPPRSLDEMDAPPTPTTSAFRLPIFSRMSTSEDL